MASTPTIPAPRKPALPPLNLLRLLSSSLLHRRSRTLAAWVALTVCAAVSTALLSLYADLDSKMHRQFRSFGANIIATAPATRPFTAADIANATAAADESGSDALIVPFAYAIATNPSGSPIVAAGTNLAQARALNSSWQINSTNAAKTTTQPSEFEALVGSRAYSSLGNSPSITLTYAGRSQPLHITGILHTGGPEDSRVYLELTDFTAWTGLSPTTLEIQIPGTAGRIESTLARLQTALPGIEVHPVRQLVEGESNIVERTRSLMFGSLILISLTVAICVLATLSSSVLERRKDFAIMKALGSSHARLTALFLLETVILALAGVISGYILGSLAAFAIGRSNFQANILPHISVLPPVLVLNLAVALLAALVPLRLLRNIQPAALLKGE